MADLPQAVRQRFISEQGTFLIRVFPSQDIWNFDPLKLFVKSLWSVDPNAVGDPVLLYVFTLGFRNACRNAESVVTANAGAASDLAATEARSLRARGMSAYRNGDANAAIADLDRALQLDPTYLPAYIDRGIISYRMRKFGRAFAEFRMLIFGMAMVGIMVWRPRGLLAHRAPSIVLGASKAG